jgi:hypothetical protein
MAKRTEREFHIALGKLLDRVRVQNAWSKDSFHDAAKHVANVSPAEAVRFFKALTKTAYLKPGSDKRRLTQNFNASIWKNQDAMLAVVKEVLGLNDNIVVSRGPKLGSHRKPKTVPTETVAIEIVPEEVVNPLEYFTAQDLVAELRNRGYAVTCAREVITIETL